MGWLAWLLTVKISLGSPTLPSLLSMIAARRERIEH